MSRVILFGTFDLLHPGHEFVFNEAAKLGTVTVIVARDTSVERIKKRKPMETEVIRAENIRKKFPAFTVELGSSTDFFEPILKHKPDLILLGYDQKLPPGIAEEMLPAPVLRLPGYKPEVFKSSLMKGR